MTTNFYSFIDERGRKFKINHAQHKYLTKNCRVVCDMPTELFETSNVIHLPYCSENIKKYLDYIEKYEDVLNADKDIVYFAQHIFFDDNFKNYKSSTIIELFEKIVSDKGLEWPAYELANGSIKEEEHINFSKVHKVLRIRKFERHGR